MQGSLMDANGRKFLFVGWENLIGFLSQERIGEPTFHMQLERTIVPVMYERSVFLSSGLSRLIFRRLSGMDTDEAQDDFLTQAANDAADEIAHLARPVPRALLDRRPVGKILYATVDEEKRILSAVNCPKPWGCR